MPLEFTRKRDFAKSASSGLPTFSLCVLGRSWSVLSISFNQLEAFSQSLSLSTHTIFHGTSTVENVLVQGSLRLANLGYAGDAHVYVHLDFCMFYFLVCGSLFLLSTCTHSRIQWKHTWHYISLLYRGAFRNLKIF